MYANSSSDQTFSPDDGSVTRHLSRMSAFAARRPRFNALSEAGISDPR